MEGKFDSSGDNRARTAVRGGCTGLASSVHAYVDGELDPSHVGDIEQHLAECSDCSERVATTRAVRGALKRTGTRRASESLRERAIAAMAQEHARQAAVAVAASAADDSPHEAPPPRGMVRLRYAVALSAAAGIVFAMGISRLNTPPVGDLASSKQNVNTATASLDSIIDDLVDLHAAPLPPETKNLDELGRFDQLVGVPVRRPAFQPFHATFDGARVHAMRDRRRAALLQYTLQNKHRVTVYVFDSQKLPVRATALVPRQVKERDRPIYVGTFRGYSVAAAERGGVGYALASDLDDEESTQLVLAAVGQ